MKVFVLDKHKKPLMPCNAARARKLLKAGRAVVHRRHPFIIRLKDRLQEESTTQPVRLKFDPGSKVTGIAIIRETGQVLHLAELKHKNMGVKPWLNPQTGQWERRNGTLLQRSQRRRRRRSANLRYRKCRFNRVKPKGWLAPSLMARVDNILSWTGKYRAWVPVTAISVEKVRFDTQKMVNPEISGVEYQQGTLFGYELKEYLLEKWNWECVYCGAKDKPLTVEHILAKTRGGSDRLSNLTIACKDCNLRKNNLSIEVFLAQIRKPKLLKTLLAQAQRPMNDVAAVNSTRKRMVEMLEETGLPVETGTGALTKFNRKQHGLSKSHAWDALCVGESTPAHLSGVDCQVLQIIAVGRGRYQKTLVDRYGFPRGYIQRKKSSDGFQTNDFVRLSVPLTSRSKYAGMVREGHVVIRHKGNFDLKTATGERISSTRKNFTLLERGAGYMFVL